ncbi:ATP-dependent RNA helicase DDX54 [Puma concolor]|uniref:RNA helicase n=1 Tax=Puma concolor TaxID=9696 RepID=A0A6P6IME8_PUMCO|nr:ATP-dependent RNA helicase DDX54 [Puma concolor]
MAAGTRPAAGPRSRAAMAQWRKKKGLRKRRGAASQARSSDSEDGEFEIQAEDDARAQKLGPGRPLPTFPTSECTSDVEPDTRDMVRAQNKKKKKSGGFQSMGLSYPVFKGIMKKGYKVPTPIQRKTIPMILDGKDVVAMARTGSGKTACFLIPMFERLKTRSAQTGARALVLSPTRELALQTMKFTKELGKFTGLRTALILGGDKIEDQFAALHENPDVIIATPGRLVHVAVEMNLKLQSVEYVVFDEADSLLTALPPSRLHSAQLLTTQGVSCAHIYSALDQTARKINLAKFTHGKCSTLIVTDLAARGLDIPLLDNVINYSFPAKGKLFLHRVGRVARAGRSGTAYSLVAPDEVPYLLDLHLFLGRALTLAHPHEGPSGAAGGDGVLGRVPQSVVDDEEGGLRSALSASLELRGLGRVADNAQQQYVRSRPAPSPESIKRAKELDVTGLGLHPLFSSRFEEEELQRLRMVDTIKRYRSRATIFEINASSRDLSSQVMRAKRQKDHKAIATFQQGRQGRQEQQEGPAGPGPGCPAPREERPEEEEEAAGESLEDVFTEVIGRKRQQPGPERGAKRRREEARHRDREFYIHYRPKDFDSERGSVAGWSWGAEGKRAAPAPSLHGSPPKSLSRRDRKKKRFVGQSGQEDKKKIKTESGHYISSSYKRDLYRKWKQKQKVDDRDSEDEGASQQRGPERRGGKRGRGQGASQPRTPAGPAGRVRSELKTKQQILKQRRRAQKLRFLQRGGLKQLSARNRRRAQELQQGAFGRGARSKKGKVRKSM